MHARRIVCRVGGQALEEGDEVFGRLLSLFSFHAHLEGVVSVEVDLGVALLGSEQRDVLVLDGLEEEQAVLEGGVGMRFYSSGGYGRSGARGLWDWDANI